MIILAGSTLAVCMLLLAYTQHLQRRINDQVIAALKDVVEILKKHDSQLKENKA